MKRLVALTGTILMLCLFTGFYFTPSASADTTALNSQKTTVFEDVFILKSENNRLVVYKNGENKPYTVTDTQVSNLPKSDKISLENGIEIHGESALRRALEDYCS